MNVLGIDIGNANCVVAAVLKGGVEVVLNEELKRETPACVAFGDRQRFFGSAAASPNRGITVVSQIKRLIGRPLSDPALQKDLKTLLPDLVVSEDTHGYPVLHLKYRNQEMELSPTQILGMLLGSLKRSAKRTLQGQVSDCCIAVPAHFNDVQCLAVLHAAEIAGLHPLRLIREYSAAVLEYGIYREDFAVDNRTSPHIAAFVDIGHSTAQVAVAEFRAGGARILARGADPDLGGRDFDRVLFHYFADKLKAEDPVFDVSNNARASVRLQTACQKIKTVLSANPEATMHIECFMDNKDASGLITRKAFEGICAPLLERLRLLLQKVLEEAQLQPDAVKAVELIGSGSRVPAIVRVVGEVFRQEPRRTLNASECVARGCALQAAMLSPAFQVKEFKIHEDIISGVDILRNNIIPKIPVVSAKMPDHTVTNQNQISNEKIAVSNGKENEFSFSLAYTMTSEDQHAKTPRTCEVGTFKLSQSGCAQLIIDLKLNLHGAISIDSVTMLPVELEFLQVAPKDDSRKEINDSASLHVQSDGGGGKLDGTHDTCDAGDLSIKTGNDHPSDNQGSHSAMSLSWKEENIGFQFSEHVRGPFSKEDLENAKKLERQMATWDEVVEETKNQKNALESYVYEMRKKLHDKYQEFVSYADRQVFMEKLHQAEKWLGHESEDLECDAYSLKLMELKLIGDPIEARFRESLERGEAVEQLRRCIEHFRYDDNRTGKSRVRKKEKKEILYQCEKVEEWLYKMMAMQDDSPKWEDSILTVQELRNKTDYLDSCCSEILNRRHSRHHPIVWQPWQVIRRQKQHLRAGEKDTRLRNDAYHQQIPPVPLQIEGMEAQDQRQQDDEFADAESGEETPENYQENQRVEEPLASREMRQVVSWNGIPVPRASTDIVNYRRAVSLQERSVNAGPSQGQQQCQLQDTGNELHQQQVGQTNPGFPPTSRFITQHNSGSEQGSSRRLQTPHPVQTQPVPFGIQHHHSDELNALAETALPPGGQLKTDYLRLTEDVRRHEEYSWKMQPQGDIIHNSRTTYVQSGVPPLQPANPGATWPHGQHRPTYVQSGVPPLQPANPGATWPHGQHRREHSQKTSRHCQASGDQKSRRRRFSLDKILKF